jgi:hypothetical protein
MTVTPRIGYIKTFSAGLGRGSAEVSVDGKPISLPFTSAVVKGPPTQLRSGKKVHLTVDDKQPRIVTVELAEPPAASAGDSSGDAAPELPASPRKRAPVMPSTGAKARFTKENFVRRGSRLDFR